MLYPNIILEGAKHYSYVQWANAWTGLLDEQCSVLIEGKQIGSTEEFVNQLANSHDIDMLIVHFTEEDHNKDYRSIARQLKDRFDDRWGQRPA